MLERWLLSIAAIFTFAVATAQHTVSGVVIDGETNQPLLGANVLIKGTSIGASSDIDGKFTLKTSQTQGTLVFSYVSFENKEVPFRISNGKAFVRVVLQPDAQSLEEVVVTGSALMDIAQERKTPVAVSTIRASEIVEKLGNQEFPELLNRTPSVYATKSGGGYGDSKINLRGFSSQNIAVMVNGMPVNDMETGKVYWSNWSGIADVTSAMQVQRGLGASKLAIASIGGTINIVTKASDMPESGTVSLAIGNDGYNKELVAYNTGKTKSNWSTSLLLSRTSGSMYADGTKFQGYNYYFALGYTPSEKHSFQFMITGAPQWHNQRRYEISIADYLKYGSDGKPNRKYNSQWGYHNGEEYALYVNAYHKPVAMLNWDWNMDSSSTLNTVVYASLGRGGGAKLDDRNISAYRNQDTGLFDIDRLVQDNAAAGLVKNYRVKDVNSHDWYGILSNFNHKLNEHWSFNTGIDTRYYKGYHYVVVNDLLGGKYVSDLSNKNLTTARQIYNTVDISPNYNPFNSRLDPLEDRISYSSNGEVYWGGIFGQVEYSSKKLSAFAQWSSSVQGFQRIDDFLKEGTLALTGKPESAMKTTTGYKTITGYNLKGGLNYNINEYHNIFFNAGYYSKQPLAAAVYPNYKNFLNPNLQNEKILGLEAGYGLKYNGLNVGLNVYRTSWKDRYERKDNQKDTDNTRYMVELEGLQEIHQGVEVEANYRINDYVKLNGMFSLGDWYYKGNATARTFRSDNNEEYTIKSQQALGNTTNQFTTYLDNTKVGETAQLTANLGVTVNPIKNLKFDLNWQYVNDLYAKLDVNTFSNKTSAEKGVLKLPSYNLFDLGASYKFNIAEKKTLSLLVNVNNLLDTYYIAESSTNIHATNTSVTYKGVDVNNRVFFGYGRTWNVALKYNF